VWGPPASIIMRRLRRPGCPLGPLSDEDVHVHAHTQTHTHTHTNTHTLLLSALLYIHSFARPQDLIIVSQTRTYTHTLVHVCVHTHSPSAPGCS